MIEIILMMILGVVVGSFLNVCIYRIPEGKDIHLSRSHCRWCKHPLGVFDLIPVLSFLALGGRCRYCRKKVSYQYVTVEILNSLLYGFVIAYRGLSLDSLLICMLVSFMIVLSLIDIKHMLLPTSIIRVAVIIALCIRGLSSFIEGDIQILLAGIWGGIVGYGILALIYYGSLYILKKEGMGYGDVRYLGMLGVFTTWDTALFGFFIACLLGSIYGIVLMQIKKESVPFAFGPFMSIGVFISIFFGDQMIHWYLRTIGLL